VTPRGSCAWVFAVAFLAAARPTEAQRERPLLDRVEELTRAGRTEGARELLLRWWNDHDGASRQDVQRGLWLRGRLTADPARASLDFRRLVVEFPGGPFSDLALFRLAQAEYAAGDSTAAAREVTRLAREYPASSARRAAQAWLAAAGPVPPRSERAAPAVAASGDVDRAGAVGATSDVGPFSVQLGAFAQRDRAEALRIKAADAGFEARLATVPGSDLVRVRVGRFDSGEDARAILDRVRDRGFAAMLVRDAGRERPPGR